MQRLVSWRLDRYVPATLANVLQGHAEVVLSGVSDKQEVQEYRAILVSNAHVLALKQALGLFELPLPNKFNELTERLRSFSVEVADGGLPANDHLFFGVDVKVRAVRADKALLFHRTGHDLVLNFYNILLRIVKILQFI